MKMIVLAEPLRAPSNIIWILTVFDYIFFRLNIHKKGTFHPFQNFLFGGGGMGDVPPMTTQFIHPDHHLSGMLAGGQGPWSPAGLAPPMFVGLQLAK